MQSHRNFIETEETYWKSYIQEFKENNKSFLLKLNAHPCLGIGKFALTPQKKTIVIVDVPQEIFDAELERFAQQTLKQAATFVKNSEIEISQYPSNCASEKEMNEQILNRIDYINCKPWGEGWLISIEGEENNIQANPIKGGLVFFYEASDISSEIRPAIESYLLRINFHLRYCRVGIQEKKVIFLSFAPLQLGLHQDALHAIYSGIKSFSREIRALADKKIASLYMQD